MLNVVGAFNFNMFSMTED